MKAAVTGATGFIGSVLVRELAARGHTVRCLVMEEEDTRILDDSDAEIYRGNLLKKDSLAGFCDGIEVVFHCAARVTDWGTRKQFYQAIYETTENLLHEAADKSIRFIYLSSLAALGLGHHLKGLKETTPPRKSGVPYNDAKADTEQMVWRYHEERRIISTVVRPANVTGPGSVWVRDVVDRMLGVTGTPLMDGGRHSSSFVYVDSLVDGIIRAGTMPAGAGKTFHFRDDWQVTWKKYLTDLGSFVGKKPRGRIPFRLAWNLGRVMELICNPFHLRAPLTRLTSGTMGRDNDFDTSQAREELKWKTLLPYENAMERIGAWVKEEYHVL